MAGIDDAHAWDRGSTSTARRLAPPPPAPPLSAPWLLLWVLVAAAVPVMVALLGVFARYLQVTTTPPFPPLRFTSAMSVLALPTLLLFHTLPHCLLRVWRRRRLHAAAAAAGTVQAGPAACQHVEQGHPGIDGGGGGGGDSDDSTTAHGGGHVHRGHEDCDAADPTAVLGPSLPGLARLRRRNPAAHGVCVLLAAAGCYEVAILGQNVAPGLVDPSVVMLVSLFTVACVAVLSRLWLKAPIRWAAVVPAAAVMLGGAAMVLVPDNKGGGGEPGSLTTTRAWLGFAASVGAMLGNTLFIILAQAFGRDAKLSAIKTQYTIIGINLVVVLPISLGVDGANWGEQLAGMNAKDWGALIYCACLAHAWIALLIQESTVRLGGLLVSMFFGGRLIGSVIGSKLVLGITIVQSAVQVAGIVLVVLAISVYTALQWRLAARERRAAQQAQHPQQT
ncbi:hypothetical protein ABPG75_001798 [Micractinium tetrahymenae]